MLIVLGYIIIYVIGTPKDTLVNNSILRRIVKIKTSTQLHSHFFFLKEFVLVTVYFVVGIASVIEFIIKIIKHNDTDDIILVVFNGVLSP